MGKKKTSISQERVLNITPLKRRKRLFGLFSLVSGNQMQLKQSTWISYDNVKYALLQWVQGRVLYRKMTRYHLYSHYFNETEPEDIKLFKTIYAMTHDNGFIVMYEPDVANDMIDSLFNRPTNGRYLMATHLFDNPKENLIWFETLDDIVDFLLRTYYEIKEIKEHEQV